MRHDHTLEDRRAEIDEALVTALDATPGAVLDPVRAGVSAQATQWYGQLVVHTSASLSGGSTPSAVVPAATAIELLREYARLRRALGVGDGDAFAAPTDDRSTSVLLSSDYLHSAAYAALGDADGGTAPECFELLVAALTSIVDVFHDAAAGFPSPAAFLSFVDGTAGALGDAAAGIGATIAGV